MTIVWAPAVVALAGEPGAEPAGGPDIIRLGALACGAVMCLFLVSAVALWIVLRRRGRRDGST